MNDKPVVLVVDDEPQMVGVISYALQVAGFEVLTAYDGHQTLQYIRDRHVDIIVLDVMLPDIDGFELCRQIRQDTMLPILMLTARSDQADVITGLEVGADDYIPKPFSTRELVLRVQTILRRARQTPLTPPVQKGPLNIDFLSHTVTLNNRPVELTALEYRLLVYLIKNERRVLSVQELLKEVWELEIWEGGPEMVKVEIYRLRQKIEPDPKTPRFIRTIRGVGYQFIPPGP
ncbi:MAG: response regulator transcription factor [Anaerolineae bacterium]|nr:response regulator transcription factor [Anaerolineae bacterium]